MADKAALEGKHAARSIAHFLSEGRAPESRIPVLAADPLLWISPNCVDVALSPPSQNRFVLRVGKFLRNAHLEVRQSNRTLYSQPFGHLVPNRSIYLRADWISKVQSSLGGVEISVVGESMYDN